MINKKIFLIIPLLIIISLIPFTTASITQIPYYVDDDNNSEVWGKLDIVKGETYNISINNNGVSSITGDNMFVYYNNFSTNSMINKGVGGANTLYFQEELGFNITYENFTFSYKSKDSLEGGSNADSGYFSIGLGDKTYNDDNRQGIITAINSKTTENYDIVVYYSINDSLYTNDSISDYPITDISNYTWSNTFISLIDNKDLYVKRLTGLNEEINIKLNNTDTYNNNFDAFNLWCYRISDSITDITYNSVNNWYFIEARNSYDGYTTSNVSNIKIYNGTLKDVNISCGVNWCEIKANRNVNNFIIPMITNISGDLLVGYNNGLNYDISTIQSADITTTAIDYVIFNTTINVTGNTTPLSNGIANQIYYINTSLNNGCSIFENRNCSSPTGYKHNVTMNKINETFFTINLSDTSLFPAYYPFNADTMENAVKNPEYIYLNHYLMWEVVNMTTTNENNLFLSLEIGGDNQTDDEPLYIYYCNSSYDQSSDPTGSSYCELQQAVLSSNLPSHAHGQTTHYVIGVNPSINKTINSTFVFYTEAINQASGWWIDYFNNVSYTANEFFYGKYGSMVRNNNIYDVHLHQSLETDSFNYYIEYYGVEENAQSILTSDTYDITNRPPNTPVIINPCNITYGVDSESNTSIFFNWSGATDPDGDTVTYNVSIKNGGLPINLFTTDLNSSTYYMSTNNSFYNDDFKTLIKSCDPSGACSETISSCYFTICVSDWVLITRPCTDGVSLYIYEDVNSCGVYNDVPLLNGTYNVCKTQLEQENQTNIFLLIIFIVLLVLWFVTKNSIVGMLNLFFALSIAVYSKTILSEDLIVIGLGFISLIYGLIVYLQMKNN